MKKVILLFVAAFTFIGIQSKAQKESSGFQTKEQLLAAFDAVGQLHNQAMEYFYAAADRDKATLQATVGQSLPEKLSYVSNVLKSSTLANPIAQLTAGASPEIRNIINNEVDATIRNFKTAAESGGRQVLADVSISNANFAPETSEYYAQLSSILAANDGTDAAQLRRSIDAFNENVINRFGLNSSTTYTLLGSSYTSLYSSQYWKSESPKWEALGREISRPEARGNAAARAACCGGIVTADVAGAAGGAVTGAIGGALGGTATIPGVGTVAGAAGGAVVGAVVGGVGNSVQQAVTNLINWLF